MDDTLPSLFEPGRITLPLAGWRLSCLPLAAIVAVPVAFLATWGTLVGQDSALLSFGMLVAPFAGFYGTRTMIRNIGQRRTEEYLEADPDGLMQALRETRNQARPVAA